MASNTGIIEYLDRKLKPCKQAHMVYVRKTIRKTLKERFDLVKKEVYWLQQLKNFDRVPQLIEYNAESILMTYKGIRVNNHNIPNDWKKQVEYITTSLKLFRVSHNDIQDEEILILNGKIQLIDFQHCTHSRAEFEKMIKMGKAVNKVRVDDRTAMINILQKFSK